MQFPVIPDARLDPDFDPGFYPECDGGEPPTQGIGDVVEIRKIEFLSVYYRINRLYAELGEAHAAGSDPQTILSQISSELRARDELEDKYASEGFLGEPVLEGVMTRDVVFSYAQKHPIYGGEPPVHSFSARITIPLPEGLHLDPDAPVVIGGEWPPNLPNPDAAKWKS